MNSKVSIRIKIVVLAKNIDFKDENLEYIFTNLVISSEARSFTFSISETGGDAAVTSMVSDADILCGEWV